MKQVVVEMVFHGESISSTDQSDFRVCDKYDLNIYSYCVGIVMTGVTVFCLLACFLTAYPIWKCFKLIKNVIKQGEFYIHIIFIPSKRLMLCMGNW